MPFPAPPRRLAIAVACIASAMLLLEIIVTRLFSVLFFYHFSFFAVSLVMSGLVLGGILAARTNPLSGTEVEFEGRLAFLGNVFSAFVVVDLLALAVMPETDAATSPSLLMVAIYGFAFLPGLVAAGAFLALAFARNKDWIGKLYAWDLTAAAVACVSAIYFLRTLEGPVVLLAPALIAAAGSLALARTRKLALSSIALVVTSLALLLAGTSSGRFEFTLAAADPVRPMFERWNEHSRVRAFDVDSKTRFLVIDRSAATRMKAIPPPADGTAIVADPSWRLGPQYPVYVAGRPLSDVAIIGVGGGMDLLPPLYYGASRIDGYELNRTFIDLLEKDFHDFNAISSRQEIELIHTEARVGIAQSGRRYDVIQASLIDTWAATASGGFVLSENGLYTREGWKVFLSHLTDTGILTMTRWHLEDAPAETHRLLALAAASLADAGIDDPRPHIIFIKSNRTEEGNAFTRRETLTFGTILVSRTPFSPAEVSRLRIWCEAFEGQILAAPGVTSSDPMFDRLLDSTTRRQAIEESEFNISPPDDLQPYFFLQVRPSDLVNLGRTNFGLVTQITFNGVRVMMILGACAALLVVAVLLLTFFTLPGSTSSPQGRRRYRWMSLYFLGIGFGYILIQLGLHQRLIIILGHPTLALSVVLFSMLLGTGLGAALSERLFPAADIRRAFAVIICVLVALWLAIPLFSSFESIGSNAARFGSTGAMLVVIGGVLGFAFPIGVRNVAQTGEWAIQKMWAINGAASIAASVCAAIVGLTMGTRNVILLGVLSYAVAGIAGCIARGKKAEPVDSLESPAGQQA